MVLASSSRVRWHLISSGKITGLSVILRLSSATGNLVKIVFSDKLLTVLLRRFYLNELKKGLKNLDVVELRVQNAISTTEIMELFLYIRKPDGLVLLVVKMSTSDSCHFVVFFDKKVYFSSFLSTNEYPAM